MNERAMRVRDAVFGDIILNDWEEACTRTPSFQRLHRIKQLGNAFQAYPSAMHTRFEHSLGVCNQVKKLFSQPRFFLEGKKPDVSEQRIVQLAALLHDIVHFPFKHTLDRDASILAEEDPVKEYGYWIDRILSEQHYLKNELKHETIDSLLNILTISSKESDKLKSPYQKQIIEDTISADLLDYSRRDTYFTIGSVKQWDERVYDHIAIVDYLGKPHLGARVLDESRKRTQSAITELTNLLQVRYLLNERVYFYPVKIAADSLLAKSVRGLINSGFDAKKFKELIKGMSDEEVVNFLIAKKKIPDVNLYATNLKNRELPKAAFSIGVDQLQKMAIHQQNYLGRCFRGQDNLDKWLEYEYKIAKSAGVPQNSVIIYCHDPDMQKKEPHFLVDDEDGLQDVQANLMMRSEVTFIAGKHQNLWRCYVFSLNREPKIIEKIKKAANECFANLSP
jgi:hypothetical protein